MSQDRIQRRLAAILVADVVGYSRLMAADETGTLATLKARRSEILDPVVAEHGGRIFKSMGDAILAEFASAVDALACAIGIQKRMVAANAELPEGRRIHLRIGVNIGEIVVEGGDLYGDGINIAARLQELAEPDGVCVSRKLCDEIGRKLDVNFQDLGDRTLKNIAMPVRAYRVQAGSPSPVRGPDTLPLPDRPSIAVLPFANMSGEQEYFADGISEDIITALSKISQLFVVARNSSFTFKGQNVRVQEASESLGVRYILEGSVRKAGTRIRITAQLVDGSTGGHIWAERFDRELTDIFAVQDEVTREIVASLALNLTEGERRRLASEHTDNLEAYDYFLRGREQWWRQTKEPNRRACMLLERAVALDPNFASAYALLASTHVRDYANQWSASPSRSLDQALEAASRAIALNDRNPYAHWALATVYVWMRRHDEAIREAERSISLDPNFAEGHIILGFALLYASRPDEAIVCFDRGMALDPYYRDMQLHLQAQARFALGRYEEAIGFLKRRLVRNPDTDISRAMLAACYGHLGRLDDARAAWAELLRVNPNYSLEHRRKVLPYKNPRDFEILVEGLRKAGLVS